MGGFANSFEPQQLGNYYAQSAQQIGATSGFGGFWNSLFGPIGGLGVSSPGPDKDGWHEYCYTQPSPDLLCQFKYYDDGEPWVGYDDLSPEANIGYLKWRLTGIARMQLESE